MGEPLDLLKSIEIVAIDFSGAGFFYLFPKVSGFRKIKCAQNSQAAASSLQL